MRWEPNGQAYCITIATWFTLSPISDLTEHSLSLTENTPAHSSSILRVLISRLSRGKQLKTAMRTDIQYVLHNYTCLYTYMYVFIHLCVYTCICLYMFFYAVSTFWRWWGWNSGGWGEALRLYFRIHLSLTFLNIGRRSQDLKATYD